MNREEIKRRIICGRYQNGMINNGFSLFAIWLTVTLTNWEGNKHLRYVKEFPMLPLFMQHELVMYGPIHGMAHLSIQRIILLGLDRFFMIRLKQFGLNSTPSVQVYQFNIYLIYFLINNKLYDNFIILSLFVNISSEMNWK